jgi:malate synthase
MPHFRPRREAMNGDSGYPLHSLRNTTNTAMTAASIESSSPRTGAAPAALATHTPVNNGRMEIATPLYDLVINEVLPGLDIQPAAFWTMLEDVITELAPKNNILLLKRYKLQASIDTWHQSRCDAPHDHAQYKKFLEKIGYLLPEGPDFSVNPVDIDAEIATMAGPQLVVPAEAPWRVRRLHRRRRQTLRHAVQAAQPAHRNPDRRHAPDRQGRPGERERRLPGIRHHRHQDCEDSVAAVDAEDKAEVYRNWLGLMKGTLVEPSRRAASTFTRRMNPDREFTTGR